MTRTLRGTFERLPPESVEMVRSLGYGDQIEPLLELLSEERSRRELSDNDRVMPGFTRIAKDLGRVRDHMLGYSLMSWSSHPGPSSAGRHVEAMGDRIAFIRKPDPVPPFFQTGPLCQACRSLGVLIRPADSALERSTSQGVLDAIALAGATCTHIDQAMSPRAPDARQ